MIFEVKLLYRGYKKKSVICDSRTLSRWSAVVIFSGSIVHAPSGSKVDQLDQTY